MSSHNEFKNDKLVVPFIAEIKDRQTIAFDEYIQEMIGYFHAQNMDEFILDVLADSSTGEIPKETLN